MTIKKVLKSLVPAPLRLLTTPYRRQLNNYRTLRRTQGQWQSIKSWSAVDDSQDPIPWFSYPAIEFLNHHDFSNLTVVEFGSGNSSIWWLNRCKKVIAIEDNKDWYNKISAQTKSYDHFDYRLLESKKDYSQVPEALTADIIVVDGSHRSDCFEYLLKEPDTVQKHCKLMIFDNSDWYPKTVESLRSHLSWPQSDYMGFAPINGYCHATTLFTNPKFTIPRRMDISPVAGVKKVADDDASIAVSSKAPRIGLA